jgi:hypothetical protein
MIGQFTSLYLHGNDWQFKSLDQITETTPQTEIKQILAILFSKSEFEPQVPQSNLGGRDEGILHFDKRRRDDG